MNSQANKFAFVKWGHAQASSERSALERAQKSLGVSRTVASKLNNGVDALKRGELVSQLNIAFERVVATPGNAAQRALHADVRQKLEKTGDPGAMQCLDRYIVPLAYHHLACIALDP